MTENEYLKALITAAGGDPDKLPDNLKSTYYKCLIDCMNKGGGNSGGGSAGSNVEVLNAFTEDMVNFTIDKTFEEITGIIAEGKIVVASLLGAFVLPNVMFTGDQIVFYGPIEESAKAILKLTVYDSGVVNFEIVSLLNFFTYTATVDIVADQPMLTSPFSQMIEAAQAGYVVKLNDGNNVYDLIGYDYNSATFKRSSLFSGNGNVEHRYLYVTSTNSVGYYIATEAVTKIS